MMMKKIVLWLFTVLCLFSLSACDHSKQELEQLRAENAKYQPYQPLVDAIERSDFDAAEDILGAMKMEQYSRSLESGALEEIVITADNWSEYFQIREITQWCQNDLGETTGFIGHVCIVVNDSYRDRVVAEQSKVSFGWEALCSVKNCEVDLENQLVAIENVFKSNATSFGESETLDGTVSFDGTYLTNSGFENEAVAAKIGEVVIIGEYTLDGALKPVCFDYDNTTIVQAEGILILRNDG